MAFGQFGQQFFLLLFALLLENIPAGENDVAPFALNVGDLGDDFLIDELLEVGDVIEIDLTRWHEGPWHIFDHDLKAALVDGGDGAFDDLADLQRFPGDVEWLWQPLKREESAGLRWGRSDRR